MGADIMAVPRMPQIVNSDAVQSICHICGFNQKMQVPNVFGKSIHDSEVYESSPGREREFL
jgi:hypothetical protein